MSQPAHPDGHLPDSDVRNTRGAAAFDAVLASRLGRTYRIALAILGAEGDARSAVEQTWLAAWRQLPTAAYAPDLDARLDRLVVEACRTSGSRAAVGSGTALVEEIDGSVALRAADRSSDRDLLGRAFDGLEVRDRAILVLHHLEGRSVTAIAGAVDESPDAIGTRLHAARAALDRRRLADRAASRGRAAPLADDEIRAMLLDRATLRMPPDLLAAVLARVREARAGTSAREHRPGHATVVTTWRDPAAWRSIAFAAAAALVGGSILLLGFSGGRAGPSGSAPLTTTAATELAVAPTPAPTPAGQCPELAQSAQSGFVGSSTAPIPGLPPEVARNGRAITLAPDAIETTTFDPSTFDPAADSPVVAQLASWRLRALAVNRWTASADGGVIAAELANGTCAPDVWVMSSDGSGLRTPFVAPDRATYSTAWSRDGRLAVASGTATGATGRVDATDVLLWDPRTGETTNLGRPCGSCVVAPWPANALAWSPDGSELAVDLLDSGCHLSVRVTSASSCESIGTVTSGAYWTLIGPQPPVQGATVRLVGWLDNSTVLAHDERTLLRLQVPNTGFESIDVRKPFTDIGDAVLSPDRAKVLVISSGATQSLAIVDLRSKLATPLGWFPYDVLDVAWSPDSRFLLVQAEDDGFGSGRGIYLVPADNSERPRIVLIGAFGVTSWLPLP